jgi:hypothetical protein
MVCAMYLIRVRCVPAERTDGAAFRLNARSRFKTWIVRATNENARPELKPREGHFFFEFRYSNSAFRPPLFLLLWQ